MIEESESGLRNEIEFSIAILCYRAEEEIIPFVEKLYKIMSLFTFDWELILVANFWPEQNDRTPRLHRHWPTGCTGSAVWRSPNRATWVGT